MKRELGDLATDLSNYRAESPIRFVLGIDAPLLVLHGEADGRIPISQSKGLVAELDAQGKRHEFERYEGEPTGSPAGRPSSTPTRGSRTCSRSTSGSIPTTGRADPTPSATDRPGATRRPRR